jgi:hypothetical protein
LIRTPYAPRIRFGTNAKRVAKIETSAAEAEAAVVALGHVDAGVMHALLQAAVESEILR